jgi:hypothetical protein
MVNTKKTTFFVRKTSCPGTLKLSPPTGSGRIGESIRKIRNIAHRAFWGCLLGISPLVDDLGLDCSAEKLKDDAVERAKQSRYQPAQASSG